MKTFTASLTFITGAALTICGCQKKAAPGEQRPTSPETELLPLFGIDEAGKHNSDWAFTDVDTALSKSLRKS